MPFGPWARPILEPTVVWGLTYNVSGRRKVWFSAMLTWRQCGSSWWAGHCQVFFDLVTFHGHWFFFPVRALSKGRMSSRSWIGIRRFWLYTTRSCSPGSPCALHRDTLVPWSKQQVVDCVSTDSVCYDNLIDFALSWSFFPFSICPCSKFPVLQSVRAASYPLSTLTIPGIARALSCRNSSGKDKGKRNAQGKGQEKEAKDN